METTFYDDNSMRSVKKLKTEMTLDFNGQKTKQKMDLLGTPDLGLFMLASPDLERFIQQNGGMMLTTPTPTTQILFPRTVTEEQEAYARGFIDALGELHKNNPGLSTVSSASQQPQTSTTTFIPNVSSGFKPTSNGFQTTTALPNSIIFTGQSMQSMLPPATTSTVRINQQSRPRPFPAKTEAAQTVPSTNPVPTLTSVNFPAIAPINMDDQETAKLERKRARNRVAATRCRNRKLERISRLEERVKELKEQNLSLVQTASGLREQVCRLKQTIIDHTQQGCRVMLIHNVL